MYTIADLKEVLKVLEAPVGEPPDPDFKMSWLCGIWESRCFFAKYMITEVLKELEREKVQKEEANVESSD